MTRPSALLLALGDLAAFVAFGVLGLISHEKSFDVTPVVRSIVPFAAAWLLLSPFAAAHSDEALAGQGWGPSLQGVARTFAVWLPIGVIALVVRAAVFDRHLFNAFFVIALVGNGVFIVGWRAMYGRWVAPAPVSPSA
jgi:hypothetical protein